MTSLRMTSHCMTSCCGVLSLLRLCEKDCSINVLNFNMLRFIVYKILGNSQLFLTDPRTSFTYFIDTINTHTSPSCHYSMCLLLV